jgi:uncharacterized protein with GYD domain
MATYVVLINWTDQGVRSFRDTLDRAEAFESLMQQLGGQTTALYWTVGPYDIVVIAEAPDDETITAALLAVSSQGNVRTTTCRAFSAQDMRAIIDKLGSA